MHIVILPPLKLDHSHFRKIQVSYIYHNFESDYEIIIFSFRCRQATGELLIVEQLVQPGAVTRRAIPQNFEFQYHPRPGFFCYLLLYFF